METVLFSIDENTYKPVTKDTWQDMVKLFSEHGVQKGCWCMYWRVKRQEFHQNYGENNRLAMEQIIESGVIPGILAYHQGQPVGWCSIAPREAFPVLDRSHTLKRVDDQPVWSIVCFFISQPYRGKGISRALIDAAVAYAAENGARMIEAYPLIPKSAEIFPVEGYMGLVSTFENAGFQVVSQRSKRHPIMRYKIER
jgi:GNAT superfamily N-acetyltransferase